jgi:uncharacterized protein YjiS (DUF1127 family)
MMKEIAMFERTRQRFAEWLTYRETLRQLNWLDPHMLADAGIRDQADLRARAKAGVRHGRTLS